MALVALVLAMAWLGWRQFGAAPPDGAAPGAKTTTGASTPAASADAVQSIAVLAFDDLSEAHDQGYFSDGISEELSNRLAQVPGLHVAGRTSSMSFKGKGATIAQIGKTLDVASVLEGTVRKEGDRLRVSVQLSKVADGYQMWSQTYDRKLTDVFAVQDEIAGAVTESLKLKLLAGTGTNTARHHTPRFEVYDQYLLGRQALTRNDLPSFRIALQALRKAVAMDPDYAEAWSGLAMAESFVSATESDPALGAQGAQRAMAAAQRAVTLDPTLGDAFAARGYLRARDSWDWTGALADTRAAVQLDPADARNQLRYGYLLAALGRLPEARRALEAATRADPLFTPAWFRLGMVKAAEGDLIGARQVMNRVLAIDPQFSDANVYLGVISLLEGDAEAARAVFASQHRAYMLVLAEHSLGKTAEARQQLDQLAAGKGPLSYSMAEAYAWLGDKDQAFAWLDRMAAEKSPGPQLMAYDPLLRGLHDDPRYARLMQVLKFPEPAPAGQ